MFSQSTYKERRSILKKRVGSGIILLPGNDESSMNYKHNFYRFRQDSSFLYYAGINQPGLTVIIDIDEDKEIIFGDDLSVDDIVWTGPQPSIADFGSKVGISNIQPSGNIIQYLRRALTDNRKVHFLPPYRAEQLLKLSDYTDIPVSRLEKEVSIDLIQAVVSQREIKTAEEIDLIDQAVRLTGDMHLKAMTTAKSGLLESEVTGYVHGTAISGGGELSFPIILTTNGQTLHNHFHGNKINEGRLLLCDCGAELPSGYAGDMTRTFPVNGTFSPRQKELYEILLSSHEASIAALKPGVPYKDIHLLASRVIFDGLKQVGLTKGDTDDAIAQGVHALFFPHGLGHMMGLDVHDMENLGEKYVGYNGGEKSQQFGLKSLRLGKELQKGFVLTVEPGIYLIPELIDIWRADKKFENFLNYTELEKYKEFGGMRVEEDFLITENSSRLLGNPVPKSIADIESIRRQAIEG